MDVLKKILAEFFGFITSGILMYMLLSRGEGFEFTIKDLIIIWSITALIEESIKDAKAKCLIPDVIFSAVIAIVIVKIFESGINPESIIFWVNILPTALSAFASEPIIEIIEKKKN